MPLSEVLATKLLATRRGRRDDRSRAVEASAAAHSLTELNFPLACRTLAKDALRLCGAESAGMTVFDMDDSDELIWISVAGTLHDFERRRFPRHHSPCGVSFDTRAIQLFIEPHRYFEWMRVAGITINEALVCPLFNASGNLYGTIWVMSHRDIGIHFEQLDARILMQLATAAAEVVRVKTMRALR
ncbi:MULTISPECIES: hypothetical protein [unclassified Duganella]|uniref:hypothetical protein n=1 Tax=unclassified Duganella TaxID=2636909 RepID=UPI00114CC594|nr:MULTISPECIES: hypothetical protein [unclassified Duganella]